MKPNRGNLDAVKESGSDATLISGLARILARPILSETRNRAALHVLDWIGCATIGTREPAGRALAAFGKHYPSGPCRALGLGNLLAPGAILVNGGLGNILEMDDIHRSAILHPGPVVVPAALAVAQQIGTTPDAFLDGVIRGYEAMIRLGNSVGPGHYRFWHNTATCGPIGAAAAVASLLELDHDQTVSALGNAVTQSAGPWQCRHEPVMTKQLHTAHASHAGWVAAELAAEGFSGVASILEGEQGFYAATCPDPHFDALLAGPDEPWKVFETSFKPWPACRHCHPAIDCALTLYGSLAPARIAGIAVTTYGDAVKYCDCPKPATTLAAKFSLQHAIAVALLDGPPPLTAFEQSTRERSDVAALRKKITVTVGEPYDTSYPSRYGAELAVALSDGSVRKAAVRDAKGDPEFPLTEREIETKADQLMTAAGLPAGQITAIIDCTRALTQGGGLANLNAVLP